MFSPNIKLKPFLPFIALGVISFIISSCGTYNNGYNDNDGVYSTTASQDEEEGSYENESDRNNYYKQYFQSKTNTYENLPEDNAIFTDIEAYSTTESMDEDGNIIIEDRDYDDGYGPWGSNSENVTVNIYNSGGYFGYGGFWGHYYGFYSPYYYNPYFGIGYGWGYPYYSYGWGYPYYYGYGWGYPYYYGGYYAGYYNYPYNNYYNGISYNRGRRNTDYARTNVRGRSSDATSRNSYSRSELSRRVNRNNIDANRTRSSYDGNTGNVRSNNNSVRNVRSNNSTRRSVQSNTRSQNYSTPTRSVRSNSVRSSGSTRSSGSSVRSSSGSSRSSGSRSSGGRGRG